MKYKVYNYISHGDDDGQLVALEENIDVPFEIKRVFHIYETKKGVVRGKHAHKKLEEVLVCVAGSCKVLLDDGEKKETIVLDNPTKGLYIPPELWREMFEFETDTVLLVLASREYEIDDYLRDYSKWKENTHQ